MPLPVPSSVFQGEARSLEQEGATARTRTAAGHGSRTLQKWPGYGLGLMLVRMHPSRCAAYRACHCVRLGPGLASGVGESVLHSMPLIIMITKQE